MKRGHSWEKIGNAPPKKRWSYGPLTQYLWRCQRCGSEVEAPTVGRNATIEGRTCEETLRKFTSDVLSE